jgi:single-stranded-DNA-specific exonuclease
MVPLLGENRLLVKYGQVVFKNTHRPGLNKILEKARLDKKNISAGDLGFMIGPRINAAARLEEPSIAFRALASDNQDSVDSAIELEKINNRRKYLTAKIMKEVYKKLDRREELNQVIVIGNKDWPLGVLGLIAGKIADKYKRPAFVWSKAEGKENDGKLKGSCRSGGKYSVFSLMKVSGDNFISYGGHDASGGFVLDEKKVHFLEDNLSDNLERAKLMEAKKVIIDAEISLDEVNLENYREIEKLEPYGISNQKPHFFFREIRVEYVKFFGKDNNHLELGFRNSRGLLVKAISFSFEEILANKKILEGQVINLIASMELNRWNGYESLRLKIEDIF